MRNRFFKRRFYKNKKNQVRNCLLKRRFPQNIYIYVRNSQKKNKNKNKKTKWEIIYLRDNNKSEKFLLKY